jgi:hypothetical protein
MTHEEYLILKERLQKGKEYLHREYYTALGGKGRRDAEILNLVNIWFKMGDEILKYELEHPEVVKLPQEESK